MIFDRNVPNKHREGQMLSRKVENITKHIQIATVKLNYERRHRKDMTLVIGAKCKDGVVLIADKRILEGNDVAVGKKITILPLGIVVAGAGVGEVIDKFNERIPFVLDERKKLNYQEILKNNPGTEINIDDVPFYFRPYEFLEDCEGLIFQLHERYKMPIQILVAAGNQEAAELNYIDNENFLTSKRRTYMAIGSGSPYANFLLKKLWREALTMKEMAKLGNFIINLVDDMGVDAYVGHGTQTVYVPNSPADADTEEKVKLSPHELNIDYGHNDLIEDYYKFLDEVHKKIKD